MPAQCECSTRLPVFRALPTESPGDLIYSWYRSSVWKWRYSPRNVHNIEDNEVGGNFHDGAEYYGDVSVTPHVPGGYGKAIVHSTHREPASIAASALVWLVQASCYVLNFIQFTENLADADVLLGSA